MSLALIETGHCNMDLNPSPIEYYDVHETIMILEGSIVLEGEGMPPRRYGVGDVILFRHGAHVKWHVENYVNKIAFFRQTLPFGLGYVVRAINKLKRMVFAPAGVSPPSNAALLHSMI